MRHVARSTRLAVLPWALSLASLLYGCDPSSWLDDEEDLPALPVPPERGALGQADAEARAEQERAACLSACAAGERLSPTDQATCRLQCGAEDSATEPSLARIAGVRFEACADACLEAPASATDRATCRLSCIQAAVGDARRKVPEQAAAAACATGCLESLLSCEDACGSAGRPSDAATCRVTCEGTGDRCLSSCEPQGEV